MASRCAKHAASLVAHRARYSRARLIRKTVKRNRIFSAILRRYNAVNAADAMTSLNTLAEANRRLYNAIMRDGITKP